MYERRTEILAAVPTSTGGVVLGRSREGRPIRGYRLGRGPFRISLVGGSHADEPVGPRLLRSLAAYLASLRPDDGMLTAYEWWLIPHVNPDGEERNRAWTQGAPETFDPALYLRLAVRELPGDDIEFGYPRAAGDSAARPENRAARDWWRSAGGPFDLHASLHGMAFAAGPWHLLEGAWRGRCMHLMTECRAAAESLGYVLHDVERRGEKGFERIQRGFCTRPDSSRMQAHFEALGDAATASRFRPSSMETIRSLGGDPLTLVSEMPLFLSPGVGERIGPPDPAAEAWRDRVEDWRTRLAAGADPARISDEARAAGIEAMPIRDQMALQWRLVTAGIEQVEHDRACGSTRPSF